MNDELTPREHEEVRDLVLAGTQRIRPIGRHRKQFVAGGLALVLVTGVTAGAIGTAALVGSDAQPAPAPSVVETPEPGPTETPTPDPTVPVPEPDEPAQGRAPYDGDCANALTDGEVSAAADMQMVRTDYAWKTGANTVLGGIDCVWVSEGAYLAVVVDLFAYPESVVPEGVAGQGAGCESLGEGSTDVRCAEGTVVSGTWLTVRVTGPQDAVSQADAGALLDAAAARLTAHPAGTAAVRAANWWSAPDCDAIVAAIDPGQYGFERVALLESDVPAVGPVQPEGIPSLAGAVYACSLHFTSGSGDATSGEVVEVHVIPGGAVDFATATVADGARPVTVDGAESAVIAPGLNRFEGAGDVIVVTDGVNVLTVTPDFVRSTEDALPLAGALLALMHP